MQHCFFNLLVFTTVCIFGVIPYLYCTHGVSEKEQNKKMQLYLTKTPRQTAISLTCDLVDRVGRGHWRHESGEDDEANCLSVLVECREAFWSMDKVKDKKPLYVSK